MADKQEILETIKRLAQANGGKPPGREAFETSTGIKMHEWYPHIWLKWGDALIEAGYSPNQLQKAYSDETIILTFINLIRELKKIPVEGEVRRQCNIDKTFPSDSTFRKLGGKDKLIETVLAFCRDQIGFDD